MMDKNSDVLRHRWDTYAKAYAATDEAERQRLLEESVSDDVVFTNPGGEGESRVILSAHIGNLQKSMPGAYFVTDKVLVHHGELLAIWALHKQDGTKVATGYNFVRPGPDGRFSYMAGFF